MTNQVRIESVRHATCKICGSNDVAWLRSLRSGKPYMVNAANGQAARNDFHNCAATAPVANIPAVNINQELLARLYTLANAPDESAEKIEAINILTGMFKTPIADIAPVAAQPEIKDNVITAAPGTVFQAVINPGQSVIDAVKTNTTIQPAPAQTAKVYSSPAAKAKASYVAAHKPAAPGTKRGNYKCVNAACQDYDHTFIAIMGKAQNCGNCGKLTKFTGLAQ